MVLVDESFLNFAEHGVQFLDWFVVAADEFLFDEGELVGELLECLPFVVPLWDFSADHFFGREEALVLLDEVVPGVFRDAFDADVFLVGLAEKFVGLVVVGAELVVLSDFFLLAGQLQRNVVFGQISRFDLRAVLVPACRTV